MDLFLVRESIVSVSVSRFGFINFYIFCCYFRLFIAQARSHMADLSTHQQTRFAIRHMHREKLLLPQTECKRTLYHPRQADTCDCIYYKPTYTMNVLVSLHRQKYHISSNSHQHWTNSNLHCSPGIIFIKHSVVYLAGANTFICRW